MKKMVLLWMLLPLGGCDILDIGIGKCDKAEIGYHLRGRCGIGECVVCQSCSDDGEKCHATQCIPCRRADINLVPDAGQ